MALPFDTTGLSPRDVAALNDAWQGWWPATMANRERRIAWWREARFGCFIHWGVYSSAAGEWEGQSFRGYAEHLMRIQKIPLERYKREVVATFNPVQFNAGQWAQRIKSAGMKYVVITAKHHDGFAMYDSAVSDFNIVKATPFARDPLRELQDACRTEGLRFGFYYSHAWDWEHPDAPGNDWDFNNPGGDLKLHGGDKWYDEHPDLLEKARRYVDTKSIPQIVELIRNYKPDIMWFDTPLKLPISENLRVLKAVRDVSMDVVVNGRIIEVNREQPFGDYTNTADQPFEVKNTEGDWEAIPTTNGSYGYHQHDNTHKPPGHFIQLLAKSAARGGNELMNLGPMGDGRIDPKDVTILNGIGEWFKTNGASIYGTQHTPLAVQPWGESSRKDETIYLHVFDWPKNGKLVLSGVRNEILRAYLLSDPVQACLPMKRLNLDDMEFTVERPAPDAADAVIAIETVGENLDINKTRTLSPRTHVNVLRVFDAQLVGPGLRFDQGKASNAYATGWTDPQAQIVWSVRLTEDAEFDLAIRYGTATPQTTGKYAIEFGQQQKFERDVEATERPSRPRVVELGRVKLISGDFEIRIRPVTIPSGELIRPFSVTLSPVQAPVAAPTSQRG